MYFFHFTDITNAFKIIKCQKIYSRKLALSKKLMTSDNASPEVINQTNTHVFDKVRFYFRPLTPTQYKNEGLLAKATENQAHCPCPVFFVFDIKLLEQYPNAIISEKTLSLVLSIPDATTDKKKLNDFNYEKIYHYGRFDKKTDSDIIQFRQAEFAVDDEVDFTNLKYIVTRSQAEKESLLFIFILAIFMITMKWFYVLMQKLSLICF